jgi:hypothetical protein
MDTGYDAQRAAMELQVEGAERVEGGRYQGRPG